MKFGFLMVMVLAVFSVSLGSHAINHGEQAGIVEFNQDGHGEAMVADLAIDPTVLMNSAMVGSFKNLRKNQTNEINDCTRCHAGLFPPIVYVPEVRFPMKRPDLWPSGA